jgi:hypothetical protein
MSKRWVLISMAAMGFGFVMRVQAGDKNKDEGPIAIDEAPAAVRETLLRESQGASIVEIKKRFNDGNIEYRADLRAKQNKLRLTVAENGNLINLETKGNPEARSDVQDKAHRSEPTPMTMDTVPAAVKATLLRETNGATIDKIEREGDGEAAIFKARATIDDKSMKLKIKTDGTVLGLKVEDLNKSNGKAGGKH